MPYVWFHFNEEGEIWEYDVPHTTIDKPFITQSAIETEGRFLQVKTTVWKPKKFYMSNNFTTEQMRREAQRIHNEKNEHKDWIDDEENKTS